MTMKKIYSLLAALLIVLTTLIMLPTFVSGAGSWEVSISFVEIRNGAYVRVDEPDPTTGHGYYKTWLTERVGKSDFAVTLQIDYKNTDADRDYPAGTVTITVPNIFYTQRLKDYYKETGMDPQIEVNGISTSARKDGYDGDDSEDSFEGGLGHWTLSNPDGKALKDLEYFTFVNADDFQVATNFAGSIQIAFTMTSLQETDNQHPLVDYTAERFEDECTHTYDFPDLQAELDSRATTTGGNIAAVSNILDYEYQRDYEHIWEPHKYVVQKDYDAVPNIDEFRKNAALPAGANFDDYYWVQWDMRVEVTDELTALAKENEDVFNYNVWKQIYARHLRAYDDFNKDCLVFNTDGSARPYTENGDTYQYSQEYDLPYLPYGDDPGYDGPILGTEASGYIFAVGGRTYVHWYLVVAYPKKNYGPGTPNHPIENTVHLEGEYIHKPKETVYQNKATASINDPDFDFIYSGKLYAVEKLSTSTDTKYYEDIIGRKELNKPFTYDLIAVAIYNKPAAGTYRANGDQLLDYTVDGNYGMDVVIGDDYLYISDVNGDFRPLEDSEYYFSQVTFPGTIYNTLEAIPAHKYQFELYIRKAGQTAFTQYKPEETFWNTASATPITFDFTAEDQVAGYYFVIRNMQESLAGDLRYNDDGTVTILRNANIFKNTVTLRNANANLTKSKGKVYNFDYLKVYQEKMDNSRWTSQGWHNQVGQANYLQGEELNTRQQLAPRDVAEHGGYVQRSKAFDPYDAVSNTNIKMAVRVQKYMRTDEDGGWDEGQQAWTGATQLALSTNADLTSRYGSLTAADVAEIPLDKWCVGWEIHDLLPKYMEITDSPQDIIDRIAGSAWSYNGATIYIRESDGSVTKDTYGPGFQTTIKNWIKQNTDVIIEENFNGTGRTALHIYIKLPKPILFTVNSNYYALHGTNMTGGTIAGFTAYGDFQFVYNWRFRLEGFWDLTKNQFVNGAQVGYYQRSGIPNYYDSNQEPTGTCLDPDNPFLLGYSKVSNANEYVWTAEDATNTAIRDWQDWDGDGDTDEWVSGYRATQTVNLAQGSYQSVIKEVDKDTAGDDFNHLWVTTGLGQEYRYRITIKTGNSYLDQVILYDNIENYYETPSGEIDRTDSKWWGSFVGVDVTDAKKMPGIADVKVYYSQNILTGNLYNDDGSPNTEWNAYAADVNPTQVRSLAFEFIKDNSHPYTFAPADSVPIFVTMRAPYENESKEYFTHNGARTSWFATDANGTPIETTTNRGINSNTVKVYLPEGSVNPPGSGLPSSGSNDLILLLSAAALLGLAGLVLTRKKKK